MIELLFFAYRDFVGDPDRILAQYGFGRAHHRVLHFVDRYPGLTIAELLDILRITKQSLNRVLKDLIEQDYIVQKTGANDRRQRLLFCTPAGTALAADLTRVQARRLARALSDPPEGDSTAYSAAEGFLLAMIDPEERAAVQRLMARRVGAVA
ncbi:MarR family transcriptional regulator [Methylobacterium sp.]|uniref:MarR family winged helix-turn-helix transcriptional regulator n=1 Tax=Methylobacterium sp. TaxID=409 RepID=UPI0025E72935|nr:MarR family transcriptional regulator [Methylobacterium sp.]